MISNKFKGSFAELEQLEQLRMMMVWRNVNAAPPMACHDADSVLTVGMNDNESLSRFDPLVAGWFRNRYERPTQIQAAAWQAVSRGSHLLITAPTGSGKTLAAFLWALNQWVGGHWDTGRTHVLYVSPPGQKGYAAVLADRFDTIADHRELTLYRRHGSG
jgi:superfamily II RNA helicase